MNQVHNPEDNYQIRAGHRSSNWTCKRHESTCTRLLSQSRRCKKGSQRRKEIVNRQKRHGNLELKAVWKNRGGLPPSGKGEAVLRKGNAVPQDFRRSIAKEDRTRSNDPANTSHWIRRGIQVGQLTANAVLRNSRFATHSACLRLSRHRVRYPHGVFCVRLASSNSLYRGISNLFAGRNAATMDGHGIVSMDQSPLPSWVILLCPGLGLPVTPAVNRQGSRSSRLAIL